MQVVSNAVIYWSAHTMSYTRIITKGQFTVLCLECKPWKSIALETKEEQRRVRL